MFELLALWTDGKKFVATFTWIVLSFFHIRFEGWCSRLPAQDHPARVRRQWMLNDIEREFCSIVVLALELNTFVRCLRSTCDYKLWNYGMKREKMDRNSWSVCILTCKVHRHESLCNHCKPSEYPDTQVVYLPVQNFGSSLKSPQWSMPSQYLSSGRQRPVALHGNSDIWQERISTMRFNNKTPQATVSHRMIWKMMKNQL